MSLRAEWVDVEHPFLSYRYVEAGECVVGHGPDRSECDFSCVADEPGIVIGTDDLVVLTADEPHKLRAFLQRLAEIVPPS